MTANCMPSWTVHWWSATPWTAPTAENQHTDPHTLTAPGRLLPRFSLPRKARFSQPARRRWTMQHSPKRTVGAIALVLAAAGGLPACSSSSADSGASSQGGVTTLELWTHNGGNATELAVNK